MILLDTNVISELMRPAPSSAVLAWVAAQPRGELCTSSIVQSEILHGVARLPDGRRKAELAAAATAMFEEEFAGRILSYDAMAAAHYAEIITIRSAAGRPIEAFDALIAATARSYAVPVATRDSAGFAGVGVDVVDPWDEAAHAG